MTLLIFVVNVNDAINDWATVLSLKLQEIHVPLYKYIDQKLLRLTIKYTVISTRYVKTEIQTTIWFSICSNGMFVVQPTNKVNVNKRRISISSGHFTD